MKLTVEQVEEIVYRNCKFYEDGEVDAQAITDELNATLGEDKLLDLAHHAWCIAVCAMQGTPIPASWGDAVENGLRERGINVDELPYVVPDATLGGKLTAEQVRECVKDVYFEGYADGAVNRGEHIDETNWQAIANELNMTLKNDKITRLKNELDDLDDALNEVAEKWAVAQVKAEDYEKRCKLLEANNSTHWYELFGTPERAAKTLTGTCNDCCECAIAHYCEYGCDDGCLLNDSVKLLEWLRDDA